MLCIESVWSELATRVSAGPWVLMGPGELSTHVSAGALPVGPHGPGACLGFLGILQINDKQPIIKLVNLVFVA